MQSLERPLAAVVAGALVGLSLPPFGFWPLALVGVALLLWTIGGASARRRLGLGYLAGLGQFVLTWWWMGEFNQIGAVVAILGEAGFIAVACLLTPATRGRAAAAAGLVGTLSLAEAARTVWPFGGVPLGGLPLGQVEGPFAPVARLGGELLLMGVVVAIGVGLASLVSRDVIVAAVCFAGSGAIVLAGVASPAGGADEEVLDVALVQGGGPRGFRAVDTNPADVLLRHLEADEDVPSGLDLVVWPENVIDVGLELEGTPEEEAVAAEAKRLGTTLVAGVTGDVPPDNFSNEAVVWDSDGDLVDRYTKVRRVPFGEYVPGRKLIARLADLSVIPRDAVPGEGPGVVDTPVGRLGVAISYEVFFRERGRSPVREGAVLLLVPTNAASFSTSQVPTQEVAAAQLRALSHGRWLVQAAPTGYGAFVDPYGRVRARTVLGEQDVIVMQVATRTGRTPYTVAGDYPAFLLALALLTLPRLRPYLPFWRQ